ncbi:uncharacterized protein LOC131672977 [Phymastichus coffea]|uniref:uncharacterized protein LOC131672977 n=1 Tax=Phymastichus coffea TaxID=108790 RepID=UPI00273A8857|nr:uncharacterized protein LOC131672977 [Phymastichus coffea]
MRLLVIVACVAMAAASPLKKSINAKAIEPVDQHLDSLRATEAGSSQKVDRAKKDVTFCVEVRQDNKPVVVDCSDKQPVLPPPTPEPQPDPLPDQPDLIPTTQTLNIDIPCEPEIAAFLVQPPEQVVYAPTGNCIPQMPSVIPMPTSSISAQGQVLHFHQHGLHGLHGLPTLHGGQGLHLVKPLPNPVLPPTHAHHLHGVECTCHSGPIGKSADASTLANNEALAMKFLHDIQRNSAASSGQNMLVTAPTKIQELAPAVKLQGTEPGVKVQTLVPGVTIQGSSPGVTIQGSTPGVTVQGLAPGATTQALAPGTAMRYLSMRPMMMSTPQAAFSQSSPMASGGVYPVSMGGHMMYPSMMRLKSLEDSFTTGPMLPSIRACRDDSEMAAATAAGDARAATAEADAKSTPVETMEQMKRNDKDDKASRVARFVMEKDEAENRLDDN